MIRRIGRPGLIGTMARTAVVAGTATAVVGGMQARQQGRAQAASAAQVAAPPAEDDLLTKLAKLGQMNDAGLINDQEFAAAKAQLLGI